MSLPDNYIAGVLVFSGRPNPEWKPGKSIAAGIIELYESLEKYKGEYNEQSILGYSGCYLKSGDGNLVIKAYNGIVSFTGEIRSELKNDPGRKLEAEILKTAPGGLFTKDVIGFDYN